MRFYLETTSQRDDRRARWARWYAWRPVHLGYGEYAWLEWIERREVLLRSKSGPFWRPEYRAEINTPKPVDTP